MGEAPYKLIEFTEESKDRKKSVDVVPSSWMFYNNSTGLMTKFMPLPYTEQNLAHLHSLMKFEAPAPESWPDYLVNVRGEASKSLNTFIYFCINI